MVWQQALSDGQAEVEKDRGWRRAVRLWTVELGLSGDRRNALQDLSVISVSLKVLAHRRHWFSKQSTGDLPLGLHGRGFALIQERSALTRSEPESIVFVYQPDETLKSVVRRFCWTKGAASATLGLDETNGPARRRQADLRAVEFVPKRELDRADSRKIDRLRKENRATETGN